MNDDAISHLRIIISVALAMVPRGTRREYSEKLLIRSDPAKAAITDRVAEAVLQHFTIDWKPGVAGPSLSSRLLAAVQGRSDS